MEDLASRSRPRCGALDGEQTSVTPELSHHRLRARLSADRLQETVAYQTSIDEAKSRVDQQTNVGATVGRLLLE